MASTSTFKLWDILDRFVTREDPIPDIRMKKGGGNLNELWLIFKFIYFLRIKSPYAEVPCSEASKPAISSSGVTLKPIRESMVFNTP